MSRYLIWLANAALLTLCCFLVAQTSNAVFGELLSAPRAALAPPGVAAAPSHPRSGSDRQVILTRNLFDASLLTAAPPSPPAEEGAEATELPLALLGTIASPSPELARAAIWNAESRRHLVVKRGDEVGNGGRATVLRIERGRILLSEGGAVRELVFDEDGQYRPPQRPSRVPQPSYGARARRRARR